MATYVYSDLNGGPVWEHQCKMGDAPKELVIAGVTLHRDYAAEQGSQRSGDIWTDFVSTSRGVSLRQLDAAKKLDAELGVPTDYVVRGPVALPHFTSKAHDIAWLKAHKWCKHDASYGYPAPGDFVKG